MNQAVLISKPSFHVAQVTLARPEVRNSFNDDVIAELTHAFLKLGQDDDVRCIVLAAEGPAFCAGADLNWMRKMADYSHAENVADASKLAEMLRVIYECPKPTIARVQGDVYAGGMGLVSVCDVVVSVDSANYCLSEVKLGLYPATISPYVIRAMGARAAHRYFLTAERFSAIEALRIGFVHEVVSVQALNEKVHSLTSALCSNSPQAMQGCKDLLQWIAHSDIDQTLIDKTVQGIANCRASEQGKEGVSAFLEKRKPSWLVNMDAKASKVAE
ncbi:MAG TPA: enoyl-CoA hydratase/isomerase family protein [Burkholderiaceae bacterium]|nr:enoyl-CoA hydratase/isomerase family protein [Burkholderiaceae bacterium]